MLVTNLPGLSASLNQTATGTLGAAVTATLPAVASQFHYITLIEIVRFAGALLVAAATPVVITTTNLNGSPVFSVGADALAQGVAVTNTYAFPMQVKSSVVNTPTTIVCPATTNVIWRVNVFYAAAA